jgi:hypothetical protein
MERKICSKCKTEKKLCEFQKDSSKKIGYKSQCKKCSYIKQKIYKEQNAELISTKRKRYYQDNLEKEKTQQKSYRNIKKYQLLEKEREKYKNNPLFRLKRNVRRRINKVLKNKTNSSFDIVGCSPHELKIYIENQFRDGMTWENYGKFGWHIDHITPLDFGKTEIEIINLCHYTNLQPLWAEENLKKSNKII